MAFKDPGPEGVSSVTTSCRSCSYSARSRMNCRMRGTSSATAFADGKELVRLHGGSSLQYIDSGPGGSCVPAPGSAPASPGAGGWAAAALACCWARRARSRASSSCCCRSRRSFSFRRRCRKRFHSSHPDEGKDGHEEEGADEPRRGGKVPLQSAHELAGGPARAQPM